MFPANWNSSECIFFTWMKTKHQSNYRSCVRATFCCFERKGNETLYGKLMDVISGKKEAKFFILEKWREKNLRVNKKKGKFFDFAPLVPQFIVNRTYLIMFMVHILCGKENNPVFEFNHLKIWKNFCQS